MEMKIGQIIWILSKQTNTIEPAKIVEKMIKETVTGIHTSYCVVHIDGKTSIVNENQKYFESIDDARKFLQEAASKLIDNVINKAQQEAAKFVEKAKEETNDVQSLTSDDTMYHDETLITLPDGRLAKAKIRGPQI